MKARDEGEWFVSPTWVTILVFLAAIALTVVPVIAVDLGGGN
jgi:hypothetical protein